MNGYLIYVLDEIMLYVILATGMNLEIGYGGQFNLAIGALYGFGAYTTALALRAGWSFIPALILAAVFTAVLGALVGLPALRVRSHYLALVTLGFGESLDLIFTNAAPITGGSIGIPNIPFATIGPLRFDNDLSFALLAFVMVVVALQSIFVLAQVLLGGAGTIIGPLIGTAALVSLHEALIALGDLQLIVYGLLIVVVVLVARGGVAGAWKTRASWLTCLSLMACTNTSAEFARSTTLASRSRAVRCTGSSAPTGRGK